MTYLNRLAQLQQKMQTHRIAIAECELEFSELICDMAKDIENLSDELRNFREEKYLKQAYGD